MVIGLFNKYSIQRKKRGKVKCMQIGLQEK
jgi:hypothetical protein